MFDDGDFDLHDAMLLGTGYALMRDSQDRQAEKIIEGLTRQSTIDDGDDLEDAPVPINNLDYTNDVLPEWDDYIGQEPLKKRLAVSIESAKARGVRFPHTLLASGYPGVGKTTAARLIAKTMGVQIIELVPPFKIETLVAAAEQLGDGDILFIDEIHKLTDGVGARGAEILLKVLEDHVAYMPDGEVIPLNDITVIGATTDRDKLPEPVVDRFKLKPYFQAYSPVELARIAVVFAYRHDAEDQVTDQAILAIGDACRGTPRIIEEMVLAAQDLATVNGRPPTPDELLEFLEVEPDGLTRTHVHYLTALRKYFARENKDGEVEYIVGEAAIQQILRETKQGIGRIERFLVERALLDRTPRGRRLTPLGIARAEQFIEEGKGVADIA
jgi:Holliday junction DNA helicase RuvB